MDPEFVHTLPVSKARIVVLAFPARAYGITHQDPRYVMQQALKDEGFEGHVVAVSDKEDDAERLRAHGITPVLMPFRDAAVRAVEILEQDLAQS